MLKLLNILNVVYLTVFFQHFRDILRQLQILHHHCKPDDADFAAAAKLVHEVQTAYRTLTSESGLMEPEGSGDGRPLLSLHDLESRVVFTRCKVSKQRQKKRIAKSGGAFLTLSLFVSVISVSNTWPTMDLWRRSYPSRWSC